MGWRVFLLWLIFLIPQCSFAAKKDFKGIFGNYRREKFTENEALSNQFGFDFMLSTLIPITSIVKSREDTAGTQRDLYSATFFNYEASFFYTLTYHWVIFTNIGHCDFDTRRQNQPVASQPSNQFHQFEMEAIPGILGAKYRFSTSDIVPYVGIGAGIAYVRRKGFYDYSPQFYQDTSNVFTGQIQLGLEFYFSSRAGIRLETAATYFNLPAKTFDLGFTPGNFPIFYFQGNPWMIRYASGIFILL